MLVDACGNCDEISSLLMQSCLKHGYGRAGLAASETFLINSGNLYRIITLPFSQTDNSVVVYRTSTSACHA